MSVRESFPRAKLPRSHYFLSVARGESVRTMACRPFALWSAAALLPLVLLWASAASLYIAFHDDMLGVYVARQAEMQNAYEDRLAEARAELDRVASRQLLDQNSFEGKMHDLLSRQARLEQRDAIVAALASQAAARDSLIAEEARPRAQGARRRAERDRGGEPLRAVRQRHRPGDARLRAARPRFPAAGRQAAAGRRIPRNPRRDPEERRRAAPRPTSPPPRTIPTSTPPRASA